LVAAIAWLFGQWSFAAFGAQYIPMAPSPAWLLVLLGSALFVHNQWPQRRASRVFGSVAIGVTVTASVLVLCRVWFGVSVDFEEWLAGASATVAGIPVGRMSPHTAGTFLGAAGALWCLLKVPSCPRWRRRLGFGLAVAVIISSSVTTLGYVTGAPLLYGTGLVPMAWLTATVFAVLAAGLMVAAYPDNWLLQGLTGASDRDPRLQPARFRRALVVTLLVLIGGISTAGLLFFRQQQAHLRLRAEEELKAIAQLKVSQIVKWRAERLADASILVEDSFLAEAIAKWLRRPDPGEREKLLAHFRSLRQHYGYRDVLLVDGPGSVRLSLGGWRCPLCEEAAAALATARDARQAVLTDLHAGPAAAPRHLAAIAPVVGGNAGEADLRAAIILPWDAGDFLDPLIMSWPVLSASAETLLVRREGDKVLFLNELRHRQDTALKLSIPLTRTEVPAVAAVLGAKGVVSGTDYRGVEVISVVQNIPDSPWFLVAKVDTAELFAGWRFRSRLILALILGAIMAAVGLVGVAWLRNAQAGYRALFEAEAARRESEERFRLLVEGVQDYAIIMLDAAGRVASWNAGAERIKGYAEGEVIGQHFCRFYPPEALAGGKPEQLLRVAVAEGRAEDEGWRVRKDGSRFWATVALTALRDARGTLRGFANVTRDITARKQAEEELRRNQARLQSLWNISQHEGHDLPDLVDYALEEAIKLTGSTVGWFGSYDEGSRILTIVAWSKEVMAACGVSPRTREFPLANAGLWAEGIRRRAPFILNDLQAVRGNKRNYPPGHLEISRFLTIPLFSGKGIVAAVAVANKRQDYDEDDVRQLSLLMDSVRALLDRKRVEEENARLEARLRQQQKLEAIGTLASGVAHEINNPLNGVMNYAQLLLDKAEAGSPAAAFAGEIIRETERMAGIVRDLLQFARQEKQAHSPASLRDIVEGTLTLIGAVLRRDQITLLVDLPEALPKIKCRSQQIQQVVMNLLINARDALNEKYPGYHQDKRLEVRAQALDKEGQPWVRLTVEDHGPGIPADIRERIFDPFFTTKPRDKGTGLGLAIGYGIVQEHRGQLHFETELGQWTRFHLDLRVENGWKL
jgi:PAS domain S-box-containing protein